MKAEGFSVTREVRKELTTFGTVTFFQHSDLQDVIHGMCVGFVRTLLPHTSWLTDVKILT